LKLRERKDRTDLKDACTYDRARESDREFVFVRTDAPVGWRRWRCKVGSGGMFLNQCVRCVMRVDQHPSTPLHVSRSSIESLRVFGLRPGGVYVFITAGPSTKLFACVGRGILEDMCYERRRAEACVD